MLISYNIYLWLLYYNLYYIRVICKYSQKAYLHKFVFYYDVHGTFIADICVEFLLLKGKKTDDDKNL